MMTTHLQERLLRQAELVHLPHAGPAGVLSAGQVARELQPAIRGLALAITDRGMREYCATLAATPPHEWRAARCPERVLLVSAVNLLVRSTQENVRAALAFWASEQDPAVWRAVAQ